MQPSHKWYIAAIIFSMSGVAATIRGDILHRRERKSEKNWETATGESNHVSLTSSDTERSFEQVDPNHVQAGFRGVSER